MTPNILTSADAVIRGPRHGGTYPTGDSPCLNPEFLFPETAGVNPEISTAFCRQDLWVGKDHPAHRRGHHPLPQHPMVHRDGGASANHRDVSLPSGGVTPDIEAVLHPGHLPFNIPFPGP